MILDSYTPPKTNIDKGATCPNPHLLPIPRLYRLSHNAPTSELPLPTPYRYPITMAPPPQQPSQSRSHSQEPSTSTQTLTQAQTYTDTPVLRLRATGPLPSTTVQNRARIHWASDVIDNEGLGRKRSKGIYTPVPFSFQPTSLLPPCPHCLSRKTDEWCARLI